MAPSLSRHLLVWTTLPIAVLLSYLWFRKKRAETIRTDPGRNKSCQVEKSLAEELRAVEEEIACSSPAKAISRSLSGVDSAPIDIIFPPELKSAKSSQVVISDEDLDLEIEKIKSMKNSAEFYNKLKDSKSHSLSTPKSTKSSGGASKKVVLTTSPKKEAKPTSTKKTGQTNSGNKSRMAQKDIVPVASAEKKVLKTENKQLCVKESNKTDTAKASTTRNEADIQRQSSERDSANHSPADVMLASPSLSSISDSHSEGSSDSGKGCSEVATPPSRTPAGDGSVSGDVALPAIYEFVIPQSLVGRLIGRFGSSVAQIKNKTNTHIVIKKHPETTKMKICAIEGTPLEIENALEMIRIKFPERHFPEITLEQVIFEPVVNTIPLLPEHSCLKLIEGINNDTIVTCMVSPNHLFLQQPTHPTFPNLNFLSNCMNVAYADANSPLLPNPIPENSVCAAFSLGAWYRALVLSSDTEADTSYVKFLDYGGFATIKNSDLRQIRGDFLMLPFQASECILSNIKPVGGEDAEWSEEAFTLVADLTKGAIICAQIFDYTEEGIPLVMIYVVLGPQQLVYLNGELVTRGFAEWIFTETPEDEEEVEGAVGGVCI